MTPERDIQQDNILKTIARIWRKHPELRFCQLIEDITVENDNFYCEDSAFEKKAYEFEKGNKYEKN